MNITRFTPPTTQVKASNPQRSGNENIAALAQDIINYFGSLEGKKPRLSPIQAVRVADEQARLSFVERIKQVGGLDKLPEVARDAWLKQRLPEGISYETIEEEPAGVVDIGRSILQDLKAQLEQKQKKD